MDLSILIISYNTRELTLACLESVYAQTRDIRFEVVVVDNASRDGSADVIAGRFPEVRLLALSDNRGFAAGNNLAARHASGEFLLLLNPDTVILDGAIQRAVAFARAHPEAGIVGGRTLFADGSLNYNSCHGRPTLWSLLCLATGLASLRPRSALFCPESLGSWRRDSVRAVDAVSGCFLLTRKSLWEQLHGLDESFFMYGEDTDLCLRAWQVGSACVVCPDARLVHYGAASDRVRADKMIRLYRAKAQLLAKHARPWAARAATRLLQWAALSRWLTLAALRSLAPRRRAGADVWREIWRRRAEFSNVTSLPVGRSGLPATAAHQ